MARRTPTNNRHDRMTSNGAPPTPLVQPPPKTLVNQLFELLPQEGLTEQQMAFFDEVVQNDMSTRMGAFDRQGSDRRRDIRKECGYPITTRMHSDFYWDLYSTDPIAARSVEVYAKEAWQVQPEVVENERGDKLTEFEEAIDQLPKGMRDYGESWFAGQDNSMVWSKLRDLDILSGVGQYGVMLMGFLGDKDLRSPLGKKKPGDLAYLSVFPENLAPITRYDSKPSSRRYGLPEQYQLTLYSKEDQGLTASDKGTVDVHWSRLIHVPSNNPSSNEIYAPPVLQQINYPIHDLQKIYGASGEGYWQTGFAGIAVSTHPALGGNVRTNDTSLKQSMYNYINGFQRYLILKGLTATPLAPTMSDPSPHIERHIERICIRLGIPKRIFMGSERGELASSQDDVAWNDRVKEYQKTRSTPRIVVPFIDRLISCGCLPKPSEFTVTWPDITSMGAEQKAAVATSIITMLGTYKQQAVSEIISPQDVLTRYADMTDEEAEAILEAAAEYTEEQKQKELDQQAAAIEQGLEADPALDQQMAVEKTQAEIEATKAPVANAKKSTTRKRKGASNG